MEKDPKRVFFCGEKQQCCALIERSRDKISPGEDVRSPVWNFLGETKAFSLTFYAKK